MLSRLYHVCDYHLDTSAPYSRLASYMTSSHKYLPLFDTRGIRQAPPMIHDVYHLVETVARIMFVVNNRPNPAINYFPFFSFWNTRLNLNIISQIADFLNQKLKDFPIIAVKRDFIFGSHAMTSPSVIQPKDYYDNALADGELPRISDRSRISSYVIKGDDIRMLYKDFNEMRRFLIELDNVRGYDEAWHSVGHYLDKSDAVYPRQFVGPYVDGAEAGSVISLQGYVTWRNGVITERSFPSAFTAKISGDNHPIIGDGRYQQPFAGDVSRNGSARLIFVWHAVVYNPRTVAQKAVMAATEIPLTVVTRSGTFPVWSFSLDLSALFDNEILPRIRSLCPDWSTGGSSARVSLYEDKLIFDTGDTAFTHLCPDGWDYVPQEESI